MNYKTILHFMPFGRFSSEEDLKNVLISNREIHDYSLF
jgi:hypothetical protein